MKSLIGCSVITFNGKNTFNKYSIQFNIYIYIFHLKTLLDIFTSEPQEVPEPQFENHFLVATSHADRKQSHQRPGNSSCRLTPVFCLGHF